MSTITTNHLALSATVNEVVYTLSIDSLPTATIDKILTYGFQRLVNDKCGGADKSADEKAALAEAMIAKCVSGDWTRTRIESDPVAKEMGREARRVIEGALKAAKREVTEEQMTAMVTAYVTKNEATLRANAEKTIEARKEKAAREAAAMAGAASILDGLL